MFSDLKSGYSVGTIPAGLFATIRMKRWLLIMWHIYTFKPEIWPGTFGIWIRIANCHVAAFCLFDKDQRQGWKCNIKTRPLALY